MPNEHVPSLYEWAGGIHALNRLTDRFYLGTESFGWHDQSGRNGGWAFGSERFKREVAEAAGRRAEKLPAGRKPKAQNDPKQGILL